MRIILSPAKQMIEDQETMVPAGMPVYLEQAREVLAYLRSLSPAELTRLWGCSEKLAEVNLARVQEMDLDKKLTPAILAYDGIAYKYMAPNVFEVGQFDYVQEHLRILSGFYGVLKPMDGVAPYRLEMQAKAQVAGSKDLYAYWCDTLYREVLDESRIIINLASKEYSRCIEKYLTGEDRYITCIFGERDKGKIVQKGVYAKMARGEMIRYMAEHQVETPEEMKGFDHLGYRYSEEASDEKTYVYIRSCSGEQ